MKNYRAVSKHPRRFTCTGRKILYYKNCTSRAGARAKKFWNTPAEISLHSFLKQGQLPSTTVCTHSDLLMATNFSPATLYARGGKMFRKDARSLRIICISRAASKGSQPCICASWSFSQFFSVSCAHQLRPSSSFIFSLCLSPSLEQNQSCGINGRQKSRTWWAKCLVPFASCLCAVHTHLTSVSGCPFRARSLAPGSTVRPTYVLDNNSYETWLR